MSEHPTPVPLRFLERLIISLVDEPDDPGEPQSTSLLFHELQPAGPGEIIRLAERLAREHNLLNGALLAWSLSDKGRREPRLRPGAVWLLYAIAEWEAQFAPMSVSFEWVANEVADDILQLRRSVAIAAGIYPELRARDPVRYPDPETVDWMRVSDEIRDSVDGWRSELEDQDLVSAPPKAQALPSMDQEPRQPADAIALTTRGCAATRLKFRR